MNTPTASRPSPRFRTAAGRLTAYALACGYVEAYATCPGEIAGQTLTLWREHGALHVRQHNHDTGKRVFWDCPETLTEARKRFDRVRRALRANPAA